MADLAATPLAHLAALLKSPDDLDKIGSLQSSFALRKSTIDAQLKLSLQDQLSTTQAGMTAIADGQTIVQSIKEEMMRIDKLCSEAQGMIRDFPEVGKVSVMQRNFAAVESMRTSVERFAGRLAEVEALLREDDEDVENLPNLLACHAALTELRDVRDQAMEQVKSSSTAMELIENLPLESGGTLRDHFARLDDTIENFDEHVGQACLNIIPLVQSGNNGLVVRLALVIEEEERKDRQVKALTDAQREFQDVASRFKSIATGTRELRGYKEKFLLAVSASASAQFEGVQQAFLEDPERLEKSCRWFFNDLNTVLLGLTPLVPKKWRIFRTYTRLYHTLMHDFLISSLDNPDITPVHMLAILHYVPKYHAKMLKLGVPTAQLTPHVIDDRDPDLVREYRLLITRAVEEWMQRITVSDRKAFATRANADDNSTLDQDADGHLHTKSLADTWTMLREQLAVAASSSRPDVVEGVVDAMLRALRVRQQFWETLITTELTRIEDLAARPGVNASEIEGLSSFQDWLVALANDQIACIDDSPTTGAISFVTRFRETFLPHVSTSYPLASAAEFEALTNGYIDLATHSLHTFARLLFATDFRIVSRTFFTPAWYTPPSAMGQVTTTFEDYLAGENNVTQVLHPSLHDILVEELADALLTTYLSSVRNKGAKTRRVDPFTEQIKQDVVTVFTFFTTAASEDVFAMVKDKWRAVNALESLLSAQKGEGVVAAYEGLRLGYPDVGVGWVEAVLRCRDDFDRGMLASVKRKAAEIGWEGGGRVETVLGKLK